MADRHRQGCALLGAGSLLTVAFGAWGYLVAGTGIDGTGGALLVVIAGLLMLAGTAIVLVRRSGRIAALFGTLLLLAIVGTAAAAWLLGSVWIGAAIGVASIGWIVRYVAPPRGAGRGPWIAASVVLGLAGMSAGVRWWRIPSIEVRADAAPSDWVDFNGNRMAQKYSPATQITPANVAGLKVAWSLHTGDVSARNAKGKTAWQSTPLFANGTLYVSTPLYRVFAVEPDTGRVKWIYDARAARPSKFRGKNRGISYWAAARPVAGEPCQRRLYIGTVEGLLHAIDADTGRRCLDFGDHGILNVDQWNVVNPRFPFELNQSVAVYKDVLVVGWAGVDWTYEDAPPGSVFGIDARTGAKLWDFQIIPEAIRHRIGTANVWASMSVDEANGLVFLPVSSPENNYYGGDRLGDIPYATSVTALRADTGQVAWSRQLVHHDIWDYDTDSAPTLIDIRRGGRTIPALVQSSKQGFLYVLDRLTGVPVYPMIERPVPASSVPGERAAPTQPFVPTPAPTIPDRFTGIFRLADWAGLGECSRRLRASDQGGLFTPPSLRGTIASPPTIGGVEWSGGAVDPVSQTYVVNSSNTAQIYRLIPRARFDGEKAAADALARAGTPPPYAGWRSPGLGSPYGVHVSTFFNRWGMPCWAPPYGTLSSYDLRTGRLLWRHPFGQVQQWGFYMPESWGSVTFGAPVITASGLIFIGASMDGRVRALDLRTGAVLWKHLVDAPAVSTPAVFTFRGRQYVVFAAGGNALLSPRLGDQLVAFALPASRS